VTDHPQHSLAPAIAIVAIIQAAATVALCNAMGVAWEFTVPLTLLSPTAAILLLVAVRLLGSAAHDRPRGAVTVGDRPTRLRVVRVPFSGRDRRNDDEALDDLRLHALSSPGHSDATAALARLVRSHEAQLRDAEQVLRETGDLPPDLQEDLIERHRHVLHLVGRSLPRQRGREGGRAG
jgi:hypothetical protein